MTDAKALELADFDQPEFIPFEGELSAAVDWVDDAFGEIEADAKKFAAGRVLLAFLKDLFHPQKAALQ